MTFDKFQYMQLKLKTHRYDRGEPIHAWLLTKSDCSMDDTANQSVMQERGKPNKKGFVDVWSTTWLNSFKCECWWDWRSINKVNYHMHCTKMVSSFSVFLHIHTTVKSISFSTHIIQIFSPWYNHNGWLGVKHQVTYCTNLLPHLSLFWNQQQIFSHIFFSTETSNKSSATSFSLLKPATNLQPHLFLYWNQQQIFSHIFLSAETSIIIVRHKLQWDLNSW